MNNINKVNDFSELHSLKKYITKKSILSKSEMNQVNEFINSNKRNKVILDNKRDKLLIKGKEINKSCIIDINDKVSILHLIKLLRVSKINYKFISYRYKDIDLLYDIKLVRDKDIRFKSIDFNRMGILMDEKDIRKFDGVIETTKKSILLYDNTSVDVSIQDYRYIRRIIARNLDINISEVRIDSNLK